MWTEQQIEARDVTNASRIKSTLKLAEQLQNDPDHDYRIASHKCKACHYFIKMSGQAFTKYSCASCGKEEQHPNTSVPRLCAECAAELDLCRDCGGHYD